LVDVDISAVIGRPFFRSSKTWIDSPTRARGAAWAFQDVDRKDAAHQLGPGVSDDPPLDAATWERWFGLWRVDGSPKPAVAEVTSFENLRRVPPPDVPWIDIDQEEFSTRPHEHLRRLYRRFCEQIEGTASG
jgi:hypothetical protein